MIDAVLFDWGDTLFRFEYDDALLEAGWESGLAAIGRDGFPGSSAAAERFRERYMPLLWQPGSLEEIEYPALVRDCLGSLGVEVDEGELERFLEAEHAAWEPARLIGDSTHALLDVLRERGLKTGLVSNAFDPPALLHRDLAQMGLSLGMKIDEQGNAVPGPTSIPPAAALAASYNRYDDEDEPLDSVDLQLPTETENF